MAQFLGSKTIDLSKNEIDEKNFDLITIVHVLEHLDKPLENLTEFAAKPVQFSDISKPSTKSFWDVSKRKHVEFTETEKFTELEKPILLGISRKSFIGNILNLPPEGRLEGSLAASTIGVYKGGSILRTHDVKETRNAIKVAEAIIKGENL